MEAKSENASQRLLEIIRRNRRLESVGVYSVCSAHPSVIAACIHQAIADGSVLLVESTSSQVNQFGGYTGYTPDEFAKFVHSAATRAGLPRERILLGGDHLGPYPWRNESSAIATNNACELVRACVLAGYGKIHLDASMACFDDASSGPDEPTIARRAALLCQAAENAHAELPTSVPHPLYVIGTEVPVPGGELVAGRPPATTPAENVNRTLHAFRSAFEAQGVSAAWGRVVGMVVQPGVEFGENLIFAYDRQKASALSSALPEHPALVYEAHSTDYQLPIGLQQMVEDHFAILKVGPALTFAFREAVFALSAIERELLANRKGTRASRIGEALEAAMLQNPAHWRSYYHGSEEENRLARVYSYSDRCRCYWTSPTVQEELTHLHANLDALVVPETLWSQFLPSQYQAIRSGRPLANAEHAIQNHIRTVLRIYADACGSVAIGSAGIRRAPGSGPINAMAPLPGQSGMP